MVKYELINKEMIVSPTARSVYRISAIVSLTLCFSLAWIMINGPGLFFRQILFVGVVATAITVTGMEVFLFRFDDSAGWKQILWFGLMIFMPLGPALYCFVVYSPSKIIQGEYADRAN